MQRCSCLVYHPKGGRGTRKNRLRWRLGCVSGEARDRKSLDRNLDNVQYSAAAKRMIQLTNIRRQEDLKKRGHKVIYSLHVTARWMPDGPYI